MSMKKTSISRRTLLKGLATIPVVAAVGYAATASAEAVSTDDPVAQSLAYTPNSTTEGQSCAGCNLYQGGTAAAGPCAIFGGKDVQATGWCKSWVKKM